MANTYTLIQAQTLGTAAASVTFSSIPATYTDLVLRFSARGTTAANWVTGKISFNGVVTGGTYSETLVYGFATTAASLFNSNINAGLSPQYINGASTTANTFANAELYISSYTAVQNKQMSFATAAENNSTTQNYVQLSASLSRTTAAITSITYTLSNIDIGSSFYLYGVKNS
jgi:hypothetical protein